MTNLLNRCPAGFKLLALIVLSTGLVLIHDWRVLAASAVVCIALGAIVLTQQHAMGVDRSYTTMPPLGVRTVLYSGLIFMALFAYMAWVSGWQAGLVTLFRLIALWAAAHIVMTTTSTTQMMAVVEKLATPFAKLCGVNPARIALLFGLTIRLIPSFVEQWHEVRQAQLARGVQVKAHNMLVPILVRTLARADALADAIDSRQLGR